MPQLYTDMRDACLERKKKKGKTSEKDIQNCKKMAAIQYFKKTGKPVKHADADSQPELSIAVDLEILIEQLEIFGTLENYDEWLEEN